MRVTARQVRWYRLRMSGLTEPFDDAESAAAALGGVQAQILPAAGLSLFNRLGAGASGYDHDAFEKQLWESRQLVKLWSQRGTLHLFPAEDWPLIAGAQATRRSWWERKIEKDGGDVEAFHATIDAVNAMMAECGTLSRSDLRASELAIDDSLLSSWGGMFHELVRRGDACHGPRSGSEGVFAHRSHWLPALDWSPPAYDDANQQLARRYFTTYGPSNLQDFAYWRGVSRRDARPWVEAIADELVPVEVGSSSLWVHQDGEAALRETPPPKEEWPLLMLYRFDPLLLAHKDKSWLVPKKFYDRVWRKAGHIEGTILQEGRITGTWRYKRTGGTCNMAVEPFVGYDVAIEDEIVEGAVDVADFFGCSCEEVEFAR